MSGLLLAHIEIIVAEVSFRHKDGLSREAVTTFLMRPKANSSEGLLLDSPIKVRSTIYYFQVLLPCELDESVDAFFHVRHF